jgi:hypothetical protein
LHLLEYRDFIHEGLSFEIFHFYKKTGMPPVQEKAVLLLNMKNSEQGASTVTLWISPQALSFLIQVADRCY